MAGFDVEVIYFQFDEPFTGARVIDPQLRLVDLVVSGLLDPVRFAIDQLAVKDGLGGGHAEPAVMTVVPVLVRVVDREALDFVAEWCAAI